ncbi:hypothetical protein QCN27_09245 [Cereibacter sp. SYSU M97828]|nr:hypothetical protein [Cereibacter flavus]
MTFSQNADWAGIMLLLVHLCSRLKVLSVSADERLEKTADIPGFDLSIGNWCAVVGDDDMPDDAMAQCIDRFSNRPRRRNGGRSPMLGTGTGGGA